MFFIDFYLLVLLKKDFPYGFIKFKNDSNFKMTKKILQIMSLVQIMRLVQIMSLVPSSHFISAQQIHHQCQCSSSVGPYGSYRQFEIPRKQPFHIDQRETSTRRREFFPLTYRYVYIDFDPISV